MRWNRITTTTTTTLALLACSALGSSGCSNDPAEPAVDRELESVESATDQFATLDAALAAGYADIDVVMQNMGYHYLKESLLDADFQVDSPEILVYAPDAGGTMRLVAVEYAVPLSLAEEPPAGFTGSDDEWDRNETFQLWTLHAWVHRDNPDGVFASTSTRCTIASASTT